MAPAFFDALPLYQKLWLPSFSFIIRANKNIALV